MSKIDSFNQQISIEQLVCAKNYLGPGKIVVKKLKHLQCTVVGRDWQVVYF